MYLINRFQLRRQLLLTLLITCCTLLLSPARPLGAQEATSAPQVQKAMRGVPRAECFPVEQLPADLRKKAESVLLNALDSEALFTFIGGMKPMSSGFATYRITVGAPDTRELADARRILSTFRCGDAYQAEVLPFHRVSSHKDPATGKEIPSRFLEAVLFHRPTVARMVKQYANFFTPYGITPEMDPLGVALVIEHDPTTARNRGLGYLYGYPKHAVDFFVASADAQGETRGIVPRDFIQIPTFKSPTGQFVYAVPKGHQETEEDRTLRDRAGRILAAYRERRARYVGEGKPGVVALLRDWLDDGTGFCDPANARY